ncbi:MAG: hydrolase [Planctomycetota bacterium]|nr:hydrolase [Planctomycetota bacterium]
MRDFELNKSPNLVCRNRSSLLIIDVQEKLLPVIDNPGIVDNLNRLLAGAGLFEIPVTVTEQYPRGLGKTIQQLHLANCCSSVLEKTTFSCREHGEHFQELKRLGREQVVVSGIESHICVVQTCLDLVEMGLQVFLVVDAIGSRSSENTQVARERLADAVVPLPTESVLFEWCETADNASFKELRQWVK